MSLLKLYKYKVYCNTEAADRFWWLDENQVVPTKCPNDDTHTIDSNQTQVVDSRDSINTVMIEQESVDTGKNFRWDTVAFDVLPNQVTTHSFSYPFPISVMQALLITGSENTADRMTWKINPDTTVGVLTANVSQNDILLNVSSTVVQYIQVGFYVYLQNGTQTLDLGAVVAVDTVNDQITVETPCPEAVDITGNTTFVVMNIYFLKDIEFGHAGRVELGGSKITSSYVPANTVIQCEYTNNSRDLKRFVANIELMY